jgi:hypothetical protein
MADSSFHDSARRLAGSTFGQSSQCVSPSLAEYTVVCRVDVDADVDARKARILEKERPQRLRPRTDKNEPLPSPCLPAEAPAHCPSWP